MMTPVEAESLRQENAYLKRRCAQLQDDIVDLSSQVARLQQAYERTRKTGVSRPDPLGGGQ